MPSGEHDEVDLYLDLMKKVLTDYIYIDDPAAQLVPLNLAKKAAKHRHLLRWLAYVLKAKNVFLMEKQKVWCDTSKWSASELALRRVEGRDWPVRAHTMIGLERLDNIQACMKRIIEDQVPGDVIECGVWRGGATIFMAAVLKRFKQFQRRVFVADSFAGLPRPNQEIFPEDKGSIFHTWDELSVSRQEVENNFKKYDLLDAHVVFLEGWFKETLPEAPIEEIALLRLDADMYESTTQILQALYHKVSNGGFVIVDDYHLKPCMRAVHDFLDRTGRQPELCSAGARGVYWRV